MRDTGGGGQVVKLVPPAELLPEMRGALLVGRAGGEREKKGHKERRASAAVVDTVDGKVGVCVAGEIAAGDGGTAAAAAPARERKRAVPPGGNAAAAGVDAVKRARTAPVDHCALLLHCCCAAGV